MKKLQGGENKIISAQKCTKSIRNQNALCSVPGAFPCCVCECILVHQERQERKHFDRNINDASRNVLDLLERKRKTKRK